MALELIIASTTHPEMVDLAAGRNGLVVVINNPRAAPLMDSVLLMYHLSALTGQLRRLGPSLWWSLGREIGVAEKLLLSFFARKLGRKYNVAPCLEKTIWSPIERAWSSEQRRPEATAMRNAVLIAQSRKDEDSMGSYGRVFRASRTVSRFQAGQSLHFGGAELCMPSISKRSDSSFRRDLPSDVPSWMVRIADR